MEKREHFHYISVLRCLAIMFVVMVHSYSDYIVNTAYYGSASWFCMLVLNAFSRAGVPLFLMISGFLLLRSEKTRDIGAFYKKHLPRLVISLVFWSVVYYIFNCVFNSAPFSLGEMLKLFVNEGTSFHLWYMYTIIGVYLFAPFLKRIVDACTLRQLVLLTVIMCALRVIRTLFIDITPIYVHITDAMFNAYIGYFLLGYILGRIELGKHAAAISAALIAVGAGLSVLVNHLYSCTDYIYLPFNSANSFNRYFVASGLFILARIIFTRENTVTRACDRFSPLVFGVYLVHIIVRNTVTRYIMIDASPIAVVLYTFALTVIISSAVSFVLGRLPFIKKTVT
ncbi:MAG: acyltransferase family protein [Oscillospiraceae bacterium]|nr:acyltransferase family protein [Oscillospiraceae bacterium]